MPAPADEPQQNLGEADRLVKLWINGSRSAETTHVSGADRVESQTPASRVETSSCQIVELDQDLQGLYDLPFRATAALPQAGSSEQAHLLNGTHDERRGYAGAAALPAHASQKEVVGPPSPRPALTHNGRTSSPLRKKSRPGRDPEYEASSPVHSAMCR